MKKPSPAQARMLRALATTYCRVATAVLRTGKIYDAEAHSEKGRFMHLAPATFQSLVSHGWVENFEHARLENYLRYPGEELSGIRLEQIQKLMVEHNANSWRISEAGRAALAGLREQDFHSPAPAYSADLLLGFLHARYVSPTQEWIFFGELRAGSGYDYGADQRIDAWAMNCWPSKKFLKIAYEIKVSRADFLREIKEPKKRLFALSVSNEFYFLTPPGLLSLSEIPEECGWMTVDQDGAFKTHKKAPWRACGGPSWRFIASLGRRLEPTSNTTGETHADELS